MSIAPPPRDEITSLSAVEVAAAVRAGNLAAVEVAEAYLARIAATNPKLNAIVAPLYDEARTVARGIDEARGRGEPLGALAGVPITIKDSFDLLGTPTTLGIASRKFAIPTSEGPIVRQLRAAGAVIVGKTNVPQYMLSSDCDNNLYGLTRHPERADRGAGGSSGGEAAAVASHMSAIGLGSDLLGSIRQPCHVCGIHGFKPTMPRYSMLGARNGLGGMEAIISQPGPMARHMSDVVQFMEVLSHVEDAALEDVRHHGDDPYALPFAWRNPAKVDVAKLRVGVWNDDPIFRPSPAIRRAVDQAADAMRRAGAEVVPFQPYDSEQGWLLCLQLISASGSANAKRLLDGDQPTRQLARSLQVWGMPAWQRKFLAAVLDWTGQPWRAKLLRNCRGCSAGDYWGLVQRRKDYVRELTAQLYRERIDVILTPPNGLPALPHHTSNDIIPACVFAFVPSLLGLPAGTVAATRVRPGEDIERQPSKEIVARGAYRADTGSVGLPVGVQVAARLCATTTAWP
ncbi:MAG: amidase family protein [Pirellulales bacterium]